MLGRPYRNVPTETLQEYYNRAVKEVDTLHHRRFDTLANSAKKLVRSYGRELTKRTKGAP